MTAPILELRDIHMRFGRTHALKGVDFGFHAGQAHALLGENGSGKSTLMKIAYGEYTPSEGEILLEGRRVRFANPLQAAEAGITMVAQEVPIVATLTIAENIMLGRLPAKRGVVDWRGLNTRARAALAALGSTLDPRRPMNSLGPSDRQLVAIARAVATEAAVVILDEPTSSLTADRADALFAVIDQMKTRGIAIGFISQRLQDIAPVADMVTVVRDGRIVTTLPIAEADEVSITRLMVGRELDDYFHREVVHLDGAVGERAPVLCVHGLSDGTTFHDVSFDVGPGEIVGLAGLVGSGRVEIIRSIFGAGPSTGSVTLDGKVYDRRTPRRSIDRGIAMVTGDRKGEGIVAGRPVAENLTLVSNNRMSLLPLRARAQRAEVRAAMAELRVRPSDAGVRAAGLSGGNQQKVVLGRWLARRPRILLLDEPTRGVDVGAKSEIYRVLRELAGAGHAVLVSSSENAELLGLCDRIITVFQGEITDDLPTDGLDEFALAERTAGVHHHV